MRSQTLNPVKIAMTKCNTKFMKKRVQNPPNFHKVIQSLQLQPTLTLQAQPRKYSDPTPWHNSTPQINLNLRKHGYKYINPWKLLTIIQHLLANQYIEHTLIYTDRSRDTSNNRTTAAFVVPSIQHKIIARLPNGCSLYTAELWALHGNDLTDQAAKKGLHQLNITKLTTRQGKSTVLFVPTSTTSGHYNEKTAQTTQ
ncbi:hypothetical protein CHS0354_011755 [Potamilus streckersoni]|uniref:Uncharacterized protein n=1 Tax=Potamilus streckersoni TaxID=2493646 RepID=A0AAE0SEW9_9BIVA|nr:hypothetical protein CHS0354_011755 [Potamilus streckersoni]